MGDFSINYLSNATNVVVKRAFNNLGLTQIIKTATRITAVSSTSIDLIFTNKAANVTNASSFLLSSSDHDMIGCVRKINTIKYDPGTIDCRVYKNYNHNDLCNDIKTSTKNRSKKHLTSIKRLNISTRKYPKFSIDMHQQYRKTLKVDHVNG